MAKRKVTLYMKNGNYYEIVCQSDNQYNSLIESLDKGERFNINHKNKTTSLNGSQVDYHEFEIIKENNDDLYLDINGRKYATQKLIDRLKKR
jgi:threonine dehydratase